MRASRRSTTPNFRQALSYAVDKELIANEVLSELVTPAYGILPPGFPGYNPDLVGLEYNPELARQLLSESKYPDAETRPRIVVTVPGTGGSIGLDMEVVIEMWRQELGVEVEIQQVEWATYLQDLNQNKFQAYGGSGWQADYPDPQDFLDILFHTDSAINHTNYSNPELDAILGAGSHRAGYRAARGAVPPGREHDCAGRPIAAIVVHRRTVRAD